MTIPAADDLRHLLPRSARRREPNFELKTRRLVRHLDRRAMETGDGCDQAEPTAVSGRVATLFEPIEALEGLFVLIGGDSWPVIPERNDRTSVHGFARDNDLSAAVSVLDCVVDKIGDGIENQIAIADHRHLAVAGHGHRTAVLFVGSVIELDHFAGYFDQI